MHTNIPLRLSVALVGLLLPLSAIAAPPPNVTGIRAELEEGQIRVSWDEGEGEIASYRIYISAKSILENFGLYDDLEAVPGTTVSALITPPPRVETVYLSVLAVNDEGEESRLFVEEAEVKIPRAASASSAQSVRSSVRPVPSSAQGAVSAAAAFSSALSRSSSPSEAARDTDAFRAVTAQAVSATGVLVTFSHSIVLAPTDAPQAFRIEDASGAVLGLTRLRLEGVRVLLHTQPQTKGAAYRLMIGSVVRGRASDGTMLSLAARPDPILFSASTEAKDSQAPLVHADVGSVTLTPATPLPSTGMGVGLAIIASGMLAGWRKVRGGALRRSSEAENITA